MHRLCLLTLLAIPSAIAASGPTPPSAEVAVGLTDVEIIRNIAHQVDRIGAGNFDLARRHALAILGGDLAGVLHRQRQTLRLAQSRYLNVKADYDSMIVLHDIAAAKLGAGARETMDLKNQARKLRRELNQYREEWDQVTALINECRRLDKKRNLLIFLIDAPK